MLGGCSVIESFKSEQPPYDKDLSYSYKQTQLKQSTSADVLATIHRPQYELLSQSKSVVASAGQKKDGRQIWFNMAAFDEDEPTVNRKYFFAMDEKAKKFLVQSRRKLDFDCEMVLDKDVLNKPYANENARRITILRQVLDNVRADIDEVALDNKIVRISGMLINQTLSTILQRLDDSPVRASKLSNAEGLDFDHTTIGNGNIVMNINDDVVTIKVKAGPLLEKIDDPFAIEE